MIDPHRQQSRSRVRRLPTWQLALCLVVAGCAGGSGSSGFDISPSAERALIARALDEERCIEAGTAAICPTDRNDLTVPLSPTRPGPPIDVVSLSTSVPGDGDFPCNVVRSDDAICAIRVDLTATGLPAGSTIQLVWRKDSPDDGWHVESNALNADVTGAVTFVLPVECDIIQVAALVFIDGQVLARGTIQTLSESEATIAFVMGPKSVRVEAPN